MVKKALIVCHKDADGAIATSLALKYLFYKGIEAHVVCLSHLNVNYLKDILEGSYDIYYFLDIGSQKEHILSKNFSQVVIIDHHPPGVAHPSIFKNVKIVNAYFEGIDGAKHITASGLSFHYFYHPDSHFYYYLPASSAFADHQPFVSANKRFLDQAVLRNQIKVEKGINLFGYSTKPLYKSLEYFLENYGYNMNALHLLKSLRINPSKKINQLSKDEERKLSTALILKGINEGIIGDRYIIHDAYELKEFITLLNAAVKLDEIKKAINFSLYLKGNMYEIYEIYRRKLRKLMNKARSGINTEHKGVAYTILEEKGNVFTGTIATMLSHNEYRDKIVGIFMPYDDNYYKFSLRYHGDKFIDLGSQVRNLISMINIDGSGHKNAAGGIIKKEDVKKMIHFLSNLL